MSDRKRINLSISESQFIEVKDMAKRGGFKGSCDFLVALISAFTQYAKQCRKAIKPTTISKEIEEMFSLLGTGESELKTKGLKKTTNNDR